MQDDKRPLVMELAHILYRRNQIEVRRRRAKSKIGYYEDIKRTVKRYKQLSSETSTLVRLIRGIINGGDYSPYFLDEKKELLVKKQAELKSYKVSTKWLDKASELNKCILKYRAEYMKARYDAARLTCQTRKRVARLTTILDAYISYQAGTGFVDRFVIHVDNNPAVFFNAAEFEAMFREIDANKAIDKVLRSKSEKEKSN